MNFFSQYLMLAISTVVAENLLFSRGLGSDEIIRVIAKPKEFMLFGGLLTFFTTTSSIMGWLMDVVLGRFNISPMLISQTLRSMIYLLVLCGLYYLSVRLLSKYAKDFYDYISRALPIAVFNTAVLGAPLLFAKLRVQMLGQAYADNFAGAIIFGLCVGIGFLFAASLVLEGIRQIDSMDLPDAFRGLPARFIYIGFLALAFSGMAGHQSVI